mmetsp:Transcript_11589/g.24730  ORF Transcript_11589/g.24730 Transcript_11589/m.24730 type:complete len:429 (+) Transcript_11589:276-1562(+)
MVQNIVRTIHQTMKFPIFHRHHGATRIASKAAHDATVVEPLQSSHQSKSEHDNAEDKTVELASIISVMQESERSGAYDPTHKFTYYTEQPHELDDDLAANTKCTIVDERCRSKMLDWCSKMLDYFEIDQCIVAVAAYYQDRYLGTEMGKAARNNRAIFRVVSVTSLYIAIKLRVPHRWNVTAQAFAQLCQGSISGDDINDMEINILFALGWNVNPPIPMEYVEAYLDLIFTTKDRCRVGSVSSILNEDGVLFTPSINVGVKDCASHQELKDHILELVHYQLEIALHDNRLFKAPSSVVALAAVVNSLEGLMNESASFPDGVGGACFCQESIDLLLNTMTKCEMASEEELDDMRTALLTSAVAPAAGSENLDGVHPVVIVNSEIQNRAQTNCPRSVTPPSTSPTSSMRLHEHMLTPKGVLSKVLAFHYI